jgi:hypothetical protein
VKALRSINWLWAAAIIISATACTVAAQPVATEPRQSASVEASVVKDEGCEAGQDDRKSDLCAQWKAADAAATAVQIGWGQFYLGILTLFAAVAAAVYAGKAASIAKAANQFAVNSSRPWVFMEIEARGNAQFFSRQMSLPVHIALRNEGESPAMKAYLVADTFTANSFNPETEIKRVLAKPMPEHPHYLEPFRETVALNTDLVMTPDNRDEIGVPTVLVTVFYQSVHSPDWLHTTVIYNLDGAPIHGQPDRMLKLLHLTHAV